MEGRKSVREAQFQAAANATMKIRIVVRHLDGEVKLLEILKLHLSLCR